MPLWALVVLGLIGTGGLTTTAVTLLTAGSTRRKVLSDAHVAIATAADSLADSTVVLLGPMRAELEELRLQVRAVTDELRACRELNHAKDRRIRELEAVTGAA